MKKITSLATVVLLTASFLTALEVPPLKGRVNDEAALLSRSTVSELEEYLAGVEATSGAQIALLTIPSLEGESLEGYSIKVVETWGLGDAERDDGVLLLVAEAERKIRIEVGYGLEGELTDAKSGFIIRELMQPAFRAGDFDAGISEALKAVGGVVTGGADISPQQIRRAEQKESGGGSLIFLLVLLPFFLFGRIARYRRYGRRRGSGVGAALILGSMLGRSSGGGGRLRGGRLLRRRRGLWGRRRFRRLVDQTFF